MPESPVPFAAAEPSPPAAEVEADVSRATNGPTATDKADQLALARLADDGCRNFN